MTLNSAPTVPWEGAPNTLIRSRVTRGSAAGAHHAGRNVHLMAGYDHGMVAQARCGARFSAYVLSKRPPQGVTTICPKCRPVSYCVEVTTSGDGGKYATNALRFATEEEASTYGNDLASRWLAVRDWRVVPTADPVTDEIVDGGGLRRLAAKEA